MNLAQLLGEKDLRIDKLEELLAGQGIEPDASKRVRELQALLDIEIKARATEAAAHKARETELLAGIARLRVAPASQPSKPAAMPPADKAINQRQPAQASTITLQPAPPHYKRHNTSARILALLADTGKPMRTADIRAALQTIPEPNISVALVDLYKSKKIDRAGEFRKFEYFLPGTSK